MTGEWDVILIQEPAQQENNNTVTNNQYHTIYRREGDASVCTHVHRRISLERWRSKVISRQKHIVSISTANGDIHIHNLYNHGSRMSLDDIVQGIDLDGEHIIAGDFNLHHPRWGGEKAQRPERTANQLAALESLTLITPVGYPTWRKSTGSATTSTIDLTFITNELQKSILSCRPREDLDIDSDHTPMETQIDTSVDLTQRTTYRWRETDWRAFNEALESELGDPPSDLYEPEDVDKETERIIQSLQNTRDRIVKTCQRKPQGVNWSYSTIQQIKRTRAAKRTANTSGLERDTEEWKRQNNIKKRAIQKERSIQWRRHTHQACQNTKSFWQLAKWARKARDPIETPQMPDGERTITSNQEKTEILVKAFFPDPEHANTGDIAGTQYPIAVTARAPLEEDEIYAIIRKLPNDKAPGPDGIPNRCIKKCSATLMPHMVALFQACLDIGYHPKMFRHANTIALKKGGDDRDYTNVRSWRPIALLSSLGKILEAITATRLSKLAEAHRLLPPNQMAKKGHSTSDAIRLIIEATHGAWRTKRIATMLSLDMSGAFDKVNHQRLLHNLRTKGIPEYLVKHVQSFLTGRTTIITLPGYQSKIYQVQCGIPQGSTLSPILFLFFAATLLEDLEAMQGTISIGFADDVNIIAIGRTTRETCQQLEGTHRICKTWAAKHGAKFAPEKYKVIHFTAKRLGEQERQRIPHVEGITAAPVDTIRVLGVILDKKLKWHAHIQEALTKARRMEGALQRITASTWGLPMRKARTIYQATIRSVLTHGCESWFPIGEKRLPKQLINALQRAQNRCLRIITGAYKATPIPVLQQETGIEDITAVLRKRVLVSRMTNIRTEKEMYIQDVCQRIARSYYVKVPTKKEWTQETRDQTQREYRRLMENRTPEEIRELEANARSRKKAIAQYLQEQVERTQEQAWDDYRSKHKMPTALNKPWERDANRWYRNLTKPQCSMLLQSRSEVAGTLGFLYRMKVPGVDTPRCSCGRIQTVRHMVLSCPSLSQERRDIIEVTETTDYNEWITKHAAKVTRWMIKHVKLQQYRWTDLHYAAVYHDKVYDE